MPDKMSNAWTIGMDSWRMVDNAPKRSQERAIGGYVLRQGVLTDFLITWLSGAF